MQQELSTTEQLTHTTVAIQNENTIIGTGFLFQHNEQIYLVTNKHVVVGLKNGMFYLLRGKKGVHVNEPAYGRKITFELNQDMFQFHPTTSIDIAVANINHLLYINELKGQKVFLRTVTASMIPSREDITNSIDAVSDVIFIGYPNGISDSANMMPITRKGITATHYKFDFKNERVFLVDGSVFGGSSGSPVFLYEKGVVTDKNNNVTIGFRVYFLGIIASVYYKDEIGEIHKIQIPTSQKEYAGIKQMIDLGIAYKGDAVLECIEIFEQTMKVK